MVVTSGNRRRLRMKDKEHELILVFMILFGLLAGLLGKDGLCVFLGILVAGDMIGTNIVVASKEKNKCPTSQ